MPIQKQLPAITVQSIWFRGIYQGLTEGKNNLKSVATV